MLYLLKKLTERGKTLISFDTTSDQGLMRDFQFIGVVVGTWVDKDNWRSKYYHYEFYYKVKIIISHNNRDKKGDVKKVPAWYCTEEDGVLIHTD